MQIILIVLAFFLGGSIASFLAVVWERSKKGEPITGRSHCACGRQLKWYENIPVIGWLRVGGKTKCCNTQIPVWYFLAELVGACVFAGITAFLVLS